MSQFDRYVESLVKMREDRRRNAANEALQKSLRERTEEEVYASIYQRLERNAQKVLAVLS